MNQNSIKQKIDKVVVNVGVGKMRALDHFEDKILPVIEGDLALITGQKPSRRQARKSIAGFKTREGNIVGLKVTLRKQRMVDFITRLVKIVLPRVRDFQGIALKAIDQNGNLNLGLRETQIFPEIDQTKNRYEFGLEVTLVPKAKPKNPVEFYKSLDIPLAEEAKNDNK